MHITTSTKGYSLVEVLVATAILLIAVVGPMTIATKSLQTMQFASEQATATFLAQEGIEAVVAVRNDSILAAFDARDFSQSWDWQRDASNPGIRDCFTTEGCNMGFNGRNPGNTIVPCDPITSCAIRFREGARVPFAEVSGEETQYIRVIQLEEVGDPARDKEVKITSTVYWNSNLYGGSDYEEVSLTSSVFNLYE